MNVAQDQLGALLKVAETLKVKGLVEENRPAEAQVKEEPMHSPPAITTSSSSNLQAAVHSSSSNSSPPHSTNGMQYKNPYMYGSKSSNSDRNSRLNLPMWAVPGIPLSHHSAAVPSPSHPHPAATAAAAMLGCYEAASSDMSPLKRKKLSSLMINRDTPILRTVLGQGQADSSQPVSLVCHPDSHDPHSNESEHRMEKVS